MLEFNIIAPELQATREKLENFWKRKDFEQIRKIKGIEQIADAENYAEEYDCCAYALPDLEGRTLIQEVTRVIDLPYAETPEPGNLVIYFRDFRKISFSHMGILLEGLTVVSKWNDGPVFKHKVFCVPASFGDWVKIVRR